MAQVPGDEADVEWTASISQVPATYSGAATDSADMGMSAHPRGPAIMNNHATWLDLAGAGGSGWNQQFRTQNLIGVRRLDAS